MKTENQLKREADVGSCLGHVLLGYSDEHEYWLAPYGLCEQFKALIARCVEHLAFLLDVWSQSKLDALTVTVPVDNFEDADRPTGNI
jgi:hypothetical protein